MTTHQPADAFHSTRVLITAGATREPIDDVRFIGNRSSGRLGLSLTSAAVSLGLRTTLAAPESLQIPSSFAGLTTRFQTTEDLGNVLRVEMPETDILVMTAAVADHTPRQRAAGKLHAASTEPMTIELVPTADLLAAAASAARPDQLLVGFALEPRDRLIESARRKLERKGVDIVIANPLETMDADTIEATPIASEPLSDAIGPAPGRLSKAEFADWLWPILLRCHTIKAHP